jgi:heat shock protein HslJ
MTFSRIALSALLVVAGCSLLPGSGTPDVAGREFLSTSVTVGGADRPLVDGTQIRLRFGDDGTIGANAGCNHFGAMYRIDGGVLAVSDGAMTEMGCDPARHAQDEWLFALLGAQPLLTLSGDELTLEEGDTVITLVDREVADPDLELVGPLWTVTSIIAGDAVASVPEGVVATLTFSEEGLVAVDTGCNTGNGTFEAKTDTIRFGPVALTRVACTGPANDMEVAMVRILSADVVRYEIDASSMTLSDADHGLQLSGTP